LHHGVNNWGLVKVDSGPTKADQPTIFTLTITKTKGQVLADAKSYFEKSYNNFQIFDTKNIDRYSSTI
jgi:hypothetical protein